MRSSLATRLFVLISTVSIMSTAAFSQKEPKPKPQPKPISEAEQRRLEKTRIKPPSGAGFYLGPVEGAPGRFSMLLTDDQQNFVEESFLLDQLAIIEGVMVEAQKFAQTEEAVGKTKGIITRFFDKQEPTFMVDVEKAGAQSRFYVTMKSIAGKRLTVDTGAIKRGDPNPQGLFFTMLMGIQTTRAEARQ